MTYSKDNPKEIFGWSMYDWANSAFATTVITTILGPYLANLIRQQGGTLDLFGFSIRADAFYPLCVSISVFLQVLLLPLLGTLADYTQLKKRLMLFFAYLGAGATILLFFVDGQRILLGGLLFIIGNLAFGAGVVFYNAFLPDIASPDRRNNVSSQGFAFGYVGGGLALGLSLLLFNVMTDTGLAVRLSLLIAGVWWLVFTFLFPQQRLLQRPVQASLPPGENYLTHSLKELWASLKEMKQKYPQALRFLIAFLIYSDGIQTVNTLATLFAASELGLGNETLVLVILMIQFVAAVGAMLFDKLANYLGTRTTIVTNLVIWCITLLCAYAFLQTVLQFWVMAIVIAVVLGGAMALSRSLFSQMIPTSRESAYFGLYQISERGTAWLGPLVFGATVQMTGSARAALLPIILFFVVGIALLSITDVRRAIEDAGNEVPAVL